MTGRLELGIAWRYLRGRGGSAMLSFITLIAIAGVAIGVGALLVVMGVMNGLQHDLREKILIGSPDVRVLSFGEDLKIEGWRSLLGRVRTERGVVAAAPFVLTTGVITAGHGAKEGAYIAGIEAAEPGRRDPTTIRQQATSGDFSFRARDGTRSGVVVGDLLAKRLGAALGDTLTVLTIGRGAVNAATGTVVPSQAQFEVTGLFRTGMYEYDNAYLFVALSAGQAVAGLDSAVTGIEVSTTDRWVAPDVARRLAETLGYPYRTVDWQEQNSTLFQALKLQKLGMTVILLLIALVAAFTIISNLTMVVSDKTREIGILRAMGMTSRSIGQVFFAQGLIIGLVGTSVGLVLGLVVSAVLGKYELVKLDPSIYFIDHLPVATQPTDVIFTVLASIGIAALATLSPARTAARLYPVEAIRHE
ncbi:MAG: ABC transporter permease [Gemmatimonadaceae bacterium]|nr:ABC transporter permease [Gemmatimonadaceae bacterium]